jgi:phosphoglycolate phosphatase
MKSCIIFDLDGTLIDSRADLATGVNLMREEYGLPPLSLETVTNYVGNGAGKLAERSLQGAPVNLEKALSQMKKHYLEHMLEKTFLYEGVAEGLEKLSSGNSVMALITNKPTEPTEKILTHFAVRNYFSFVIGGTSGFALKPDPESLNHVIARTDATPEHSWILGDNYTDMESGRRAGIKRCFAKYGFGKKQEESCEAEADSFSDFVDKVLKST